LRIATTTHLLDLTPNPSPKERGAWNGYIIEIMTYYPRNFHKFSSCPLSFGEGWGEAKKKPSVSGRLCI